MYHQIEACGKGVCSTLVEMILRRSHVAVTDSWQGSLYVTIDVGIELFQRPTFIFGVDALLRFCRIGQAKIDIGRVWVVCHTEDGSQLIHVICTANQCLSIFGGIGCRVADSFQISQRLVASSHTVVETVPKRIRVVVIGIRIVLEAVNLVLSRRGGILRSVVGNIVGTHLKEKVGHMCRISRSEKLLHFILRVYLRTVVGKLVEIVVASRQAQHCAGSQ